MWTDTNPFLQGPFEPLYNETWIADLRVEGEIPRDLNGTLYRTGSNQFYRPADPDRFHWFDGDGMVHAFCLENGRARYCNRLVETDGLAIERRAGRALYNGIYGHAGRPQEPLPAGAPPIKTVAGINVITLGGRILTMHEADSFYWEIDRHTLRTLGKFEFRGVEGMVTAHSHADPHAGEMLFYALDNEALWIECFATDMNGEVRSRHRTPIPFAPFLHDFIFTENYYVFFFGPIRWRPYAPDRVPCGLSSLSFEGREPTKALLVHRVTGSARWLDTDASFTADHYINAYEDGSRLVIDATVTRTLRRDDAFRVESFFPFPLVPEPSPFSPPELQRITIDLGTGRISSERIGDFTAEFGRPNETRMGRRLRYAYMAGTHAPGPQTRGFNCLVKHDYDTGESRFQHLFEGHDCTPGEPVFVPRAGASDEDDGWVLAVWYDPRRNASEMVILHGQDIDGQPVARIKLDHHVPLGFHGNWIADPAPREPVGGL